MAPQRPSHQRILSLDGGGFLGLSSLIILETIMDEASRRAGQVVRPSEVFDLICGSSTGGLVALLIGSLDMDCRKAIEAYRSLLFSIFGESEESFWDRLLSSSPFNEEAYQEALRDLVGRHASGGLPRMRADTSIHSKTLIALTVDSPEENGRVVHVRSYSPPPGASISTFPGHEWSIQEVARATVAQPAFMRPLVLRNENSTFSYRDAGLCGFNNPTQLALREASRIWSRDQIGLLVSIGSGLSQLHPKQPTRSWVPTEQFLRRFYGPLASKRSSKVDKDSAQTQANSLVKYLLSVATDSEFVHTEVCTQLSQRDIYYRLNPSLPSPEIILADHFASHVQKMEDVVRDWLDDPLQRQHITSIVEALVEQTPIEQTILTVEEARLLVPPPPPPETNPGYHPQLDKRRPQELTDYLHDYQVIFIVDDSASMNDEGRWDEAMNALAGIADYARQYVPGTMEVSFLNSPVRHVEGQDTATIAELFIKVQPEGNTPTGAALKRVLDAQIIRLDSAISTRGYADIKPLDIIVITDGKPTDQPEVVVEAAAAHLQEKHHHPNCIGIQFVQIGHKMRAASALAKLINCKNGNMVDAVPYTTALDTERLKRIMLGGLHPNVRALLPK